MWPLDAINKRLGSARLIMPPTRNGPMKEAQTHRHPFNFMRGAIFVVEQSYEQVNGGSIEPRGCGSRREFTLLFVTREGAPRNTENSVGLRSSRLRNRTMDYDGEGEESKNVILPHVAVSHGARLSPTYLSASVRWLHQQLSGQVFADRHRNVVPIKRKISSTRRTVAAQRAIQKQVVRADRTKPGKQTAAHMGQTGARRYPYPPFRQPHQVKPGSEATLIPAALYDAPFYRGSDKWKFV